MGLTKGARESERRPRERRSREEGLALAHEWQSSGQTPAHFCRTHGVAAHRLRYWRRQVAETQRTTPAAKDFFTFEVPKGAESAANERARAHAEAAVEIQVSEAVLVRVPLGAGRAVFAQTLSAVLEALE